MTELTDQGPVETTTPTPEWLRTSRDMGPYTPRDGDVQQALSCPSCGPREMRALLSTAARPFLETMAQRARELTYRHFGRTIGLYAPLYLSNYCSGGCVYCGFAADRAVPRQRLCAAEVDTEVAALRAMGLDDILLLTGERSPHADYEYVRDCIARAAAHCDAVSVEAFPMNTAEYAGLVTAGCVGVTIYQETYAPDLYAEMHRWGPKRSFTKRLEAPERALNAGMRNVGIGALFGLRDPFVEALDLYAHAVHLQRSHWRSGISISFPRLRPEQGGFTAPHTVSDRDLAHIIFAFRVALPDVPLVLSTRESPAYRDGMAGLGISKMSVASRTTVGGYAQAKRDTTQGQFAISDDRDVPTFLAALRERGLEPMFKTWDEAFRDQ